MRYKFEQFENVIIDPIITINETILINRSNNTFSVSVLFMPTNQAIDIQLPFTGFENIKSQVDSYLVDFEYNGEIWHEDTQFQIKFRPMDLLDLLKAHKAMIEYTDSLNQYTDIMENVYYYVNYFNDMERELIEYYGATVTERENI